MKERPADDLSPRIVGFSRRRWSNEGGILPPRFLLRLQKTVGNREAVRLLDNRLTKSPVDVGSVRTRRPLLRLAFVGRVTRLLRRPAV
jgi:hypothetical protein